MAYERVNWENLPSTNTPVNATNLNKMDAGIANAVEKTGDTLTGGLLFENKDVYDAIRKTRTLNGTDYQLTLGLGGNASARMELVGANDTVLSSVEVRSNGVWNGLSNRRLPEVAFTAWSSSLSFKMTSGHALVMISRDDCVMLWVGGNPPNQSISTTRLYGNGIQVSFNASTQMVTLKYQDNHNFTGTAFIANG